MPVAVTLPADTKTPGTAGHTSDHNLIVDAVTTLAGILTASQVDLTTFTVTTATPAQFSKLWTIPANDAKAGTIYRLTLWGTGIQGTTQQTLAIPALLDATLLTLTSRTFPSTIVAISASFNVAVTYKLIVQAAGAGGTVTEDIQLTMTQNTAAPTAAQTMTFTTGPGNSTTAFDTTVSHTMSMQAVWGAVAGGPTVTSKGTSLERLGP